MQKELNCPTLFGMEFSSEQLPNCYFTPNWDNPIDQNDPFESALSSMVSSPTAAASNGGGMMIRELIGRLGSICDSGEIPSQSCIATGNSCSTNTSCYTTPLNSPPKIDLSSLMAMGANGNFSNHPPKLAPFNADPGIVERATQFSCFGNNNFVGDDFGMKSSNMSVPKLESGKLSRVSSNQSIRVGGVGNGQIDGNSVGCERKLNGISRPSTPENGETGDSREGSSLSEHNSGLEMGSKSQIDANSRKRKSIPKAKVNAAKDEKVEAETESNAKRCKQDDEEAKQENAGDSSNNNKDKQNSNNGKDAVAAKPEPPKDYIHVRARRGQATDSHSLAERVRREKISERMKFLQDLVPGCNKVTGKATVLDEIINYVQSLQRQVEFLSMKLATVNPRMEFNMEALLSKDMFQSRGTAIAQTVCPLDQNFTQAFPFGHHSSQQLPPPLPNGLSNGCENPFSLNPLNAPEIRQNPGIQLPPMDAFGDSMTQVPAFWEDDLQSIVQMGIARDQTQNVPGTLPNAQMKIEL